MPRNYERDPIKLGNHRDPAGQPGAEEERVRIEIDNEKRGRKLLGSESYCRRFDNQRLHLRGFLFRAILQ